MNRLTLNVGGALRLLQRRGAGACRRRPARGWPRAIGRRSRTCRTGNDWAIRLAAAYDLFGNGKTALKVNASKYVASAALGFAEALQHADGGQRNAHVERRRRQSLGARRERQPAAQRDPRRHRQLRPGVGHRSAGSGAAARVQLGIRRADPARAVPARVGDGRLSSPHLRQPRGHRQPEPERRRVDAVHDHGAARRSGCPAAAAIPIDDVHAEPEQGRHGDRQPAHVLDAEHAGLQRRRRQRERPHRRRRRSCSAASRTRSSVDRRRAISATTRTACASATRRRRSARCSSWPAPTSCRTSFQVSGSFIARPGAEHLGELHGDERDRRPADHRQHRRRDADHRQPDRAEHDVPRLHQHSSICASRARSASASTACRAWWTSTTCSTPAR